MDASKPSLVLVGSPFGSGVMALDPRDGSVLWETELTERLSRPARMLTDVILLATHTGTLIALETGDGEEKWRQPSQNPDDFSAVTPLFVEGSIYTLSEQGVLTRYGVNGERLATRTLETDWGGGRAEFVPMWRDATGLSFLDQAGRVRNFDVATLAPLSERRVVSAVGPGMGQLGSEILGGVYSAGQGWIWTTELSGLLRSSLMETGATRWTTHIGTPEELYSRDGRTLAIPILSLPPQQKALVVSRNRASVFDTDSGRPLFVHPLPSPAVAPPLFDLDRQTWWILTEDYLVQLRWDGQIRASRLPLVERPYAAALAGEMLVVATTEGRIYAMDIPEPIPPLAPATPAVPPILVPAPLPPAP